MYNKIIFRKLKYNDNEYYQAIKILPADEETPDIKEFSFDGENDDTFYRLMDINGFNESDILYSIYKMDEGTFVRLINITELYKVKEIFHHIFNDFPLVPHNSLNVDKTFAAVKKKVKYHNDEVYELINILKSNLDILDSNVDTEHKREMKHNILLYGPKGYGKTSIMETICLNLRPSVGIELSKENKENIQMIVAGLLEDTLGDIRQAEHGVVFIKDNFDSFQNPDEIVEALESLLSTKTIGFEDVRMDLSKITYVLEVDTYKNDIESVFDTVVSQNIYDNFQHFICIPKLTKEQKYNIVVNGSGSRLKTYRKILGEYGKKLVVEDGFFEYLIMKTHKDIGGITAIEEDIEDIIKEQWSQKTIHLTKKHVDERCLDEDVDIDVDDEEEETEEEKDKTSSKKNEKKEEEFVLDRKKLHALMVKYYPMAKEYIKGQDEPLSQILYQILVNNEYQHSNLSMNAKKNRISHILIRGNSGTGKTFIVETIARLLPNKVFFATDSNQYTQAGYVGKSVDDMLIGLLNRAGGDKEKAQKGILFIDEFDKLASKKDDRSNVGTGAVQEALLKILEGSEYDIKGDSPYSKATTFDTSELIIILGGAFEGLDEITKKRVEKAGKPKSAGFKSAKEQEEEEQQLKYVDKNCTIEDYIEFGMQRQCMRRVNLQQTLNVLTKADYRDIMLNAKESYFAMKIKELRNLDVDVSYDESFINEFIEVAYKMGYGVSSLSILTDRILARVNVQVVLNDYNKVILTEECIRDPSKVVLLKEERHNKLKAENHGRQKIK